MNSFHFNFNIECHEQVLSTSKIVEPFFDFFPDTKKKAFKIERFVCYKAPNQNTKYKKYQFCIFDFVTIRSSLRTALKFPVLNRFTCSTMCMISIITLSNNAF